MASIMSKTIIIDKVCMKPVSIYADVPGKARGRPIFR